MPSDEPLSESIKIALSWKQQLTHEFDKPYFAQLVQFVKQEYRSHTVYPVARDIFRAFDVCDFDKVKVVIIGQDPYHGAGQANGLCFSVHQHVRVPPSLHNIFKEIKDDVGRDIPVSGELERWALQGVLLLNATLTVRAASPGSHQHRGWETFTDAVIEKISQQKNHVVFLLWGAYAQRKDTLINAHKHCILKAPHPSPFSADRGFFGCKHFSRANAYLRSKRLALINW